MKTLHSYLLVAVLGFAGVLGLGAAPQAHATYLDSASYSASANYYDAVADYFATYAQIYNGTAWEDTFEYYAYLYSDYAVDEALNSYYAAPSGSYTQYYALYSYYNAYARSVYLYGDWVYDGYEATAGEYALWSQMYRGFASLFAAYQY